MAAAAEDGATPAAEVATAAEVAAEVDGREGLFAREGAGTPDAAALQRELARRGVEGLRELVHAECTRTWAELRRYAASGRGLRVERPRLKRGILLVSLLKTPCPHPLQCQTRCGSPWQQ